MTQKKKIKAVWLDEGKCITCETYLSLQILNEGASILVKVCPNISCQRYGLVTIAEKKSAK